MLSRHSYRGLLAVALITASTQVTPAVAAAPERLGHEVEPVFEAIYLKLDPDQDAYSGSVAIDLEVREAVDRFRLHGEGMEITRLVLEGEAGSVEVAHERVGEIIAVSSAEKLAVGRYTLRIDFTNPFDTQAVSLYRMETGGEGYSFSQFEAADARGAFPCWDEPEFKIPFQMTLTVPASDTAVSNTPIEARSADGEWQTVAFQKTKPLPTYLLAIAVGRFETAAMPGLGVPGNVVTVAGQSHLTKLAIEMTPPILRALEDYFGSKYPYEKLDLIAVPEYWPGAMEHPGAVTFADRILLIDAANASTGQRRRLALIIAHELAHMWFGDLVTMAWWDDLWLNESFADWMGDKIADQVYPSFGLSVSQVQDAADIMAGDARPTAEAIRHEVTDPDEGLMSVGVAYSKGKAVLGMFEQWMGEEKFRSGVRQYLTKHEWGNAEAADLWRALDKASGQNVSAAMASFIEQPGFPMIGVQMLEGNKVRLTQKRYRASGATTEDLSWQVPVTLEYATAKGVGRQTVLLIGATTEVALAGLAPDDAVEWILPNSEATGYYCWTMSPEMLTSLAASAGELSPRDKIGLLGNLHFLLLGGELGGGDYLDSLSALASDRDAMVVRSVVGNLDEVGDAFVPDAQRGPFGSFMREVFLPVLEWIGWEHAEGEDETVALLRVRLFDRLGVETGYEPIIERGKRLAAAYLENAASVDPELAAVALELAALDGDRALFKTYRERFEAATLPTDRGRFLGALGAFQDPELRSAALRYVFEGPIRANEIFNILGSGRGTEATSDELYEWFTGNYAEFEKRLPPQFMAFMPFFARGCSAERLAAARVFFAAPEHQAPGLDKQLERVAAQVEECVALRQREGKAVAEYLEERARRAPHLVKDQG